MRPANGLYPHRASALSLGQGQWLALTTLTAAIAVAVRVDAGLTATVLIFVLQFGFLTSAGWRCLLLLASAAEPGPAPPPCADVDLPRYTLLVALLDEADILPQLVERLAAIDYPPNQLEGFLLLEAHDHETIAAAAACDLPCWMTVLITPDAGPATKPRALNQGLAAATGRLATVYDAEDDPDSLQLREAAAYFATDRSGDLAAIQAPLRIRPRAGGRGSFLERQFAAEYAALFEVILPGMARLGLPFPLGGTSNHFRVDALRAVGGWDAHNVTEDADMGFRLWRAGLRLDVLHRPTHEPAPEMIADWLPQRTRWLKGFMQTWGVHTRDLRGLGWRGGLALCLTLGASVAAAALHAVSMAWVVATVSIALAASITPEAPAFALGVLGLGVIMSWANCLVGARRAAIDYGVRDMLLAPAYWSLHSLAFFHAGWRLIAEPHAWDKTRHRPDEPDTARAEIAAEPATLSAGREAA